MHEDRLAETVEEFYKMFPNAPNPDHEPKRFAWYVKLFKYLKSR